ncbi:hypothetical protein IT882_12470 [Microbacterium schleiferi]|uniref:C4-dicarboxylate transporter/malic acid transport protein n=1 Tax=Microbacterium schleiferi TaxID=69362 RepID=A0A7S8RH69_9MICO|nr:hypothetical protein [Microbacterium schleiferi]QPE04026.1 hypothetical protein IT882_12470 [Microbacterium schleiferi]
MNTPSGSPLATLHPAWGAVLMTLSGASLLALRDPLAATDVDTAAGLVLLVLAELVGAGLTVASLARLARHPAAFRADLDNPGIGAMIASWPAGLMVLALAALEAGTSGAADGTTALVTAMILFVPGLLGTLALGYMFYSRVIGIADVPLPAMSGNWFVPVVPLVLVPSILVRALALGLGGDPAQWTFAALAGWGIGFGLFLLLAAIIGSRLLLAAPPPPHLAPSWWVWLAPLGAGGLGVIALARMGSSVEAVSGLAAVAVPWRASCGRSPPGGCCWRSVCSSGSAGVCTFTSAGGASDSRPRPSRPSPWKSAGSGRSRGSHRSSSHCGLRSCS